MLTLKIKQKIKNNHELLYKFYQFYKNSKIIKNYFNTSFKKSVLICYITSPFVRGVSLSHTNTAETLEIVEAFKYLGYNCDIINYDSDKKIDYIKYNIVFGFGKPFDNSFSLSNELFRIYYGTGKHPYYNNRESIKRGRDFKDRKGEFILESLRLVKDDYLLQTSMSNALIIIGGNVEAETYRKYSTSPIFNINVSFFKVFDYKDINEQKNFLSAKKFFIF